MISERSMKTFPSSISSSWRREPSTVDIFPLFCAWKKIHAHIWRLTRMCIVGTILKLQIKRCSFLSAVNFCKETTIPLCLLWMKTIFHESFSASASFILHQSMFSFTIRKRISQKILWARMLKFSYGNTHYSRNSWHFMGNLCKITQMSGCNGCSGSSPDLQTRVVDQDGHFIIDRQHPDN